MKHHRYFRSLGCVLVGLIFISCATNEPLPNFFVLKAPASRSGRTRSPGASAVFVRRVEVPAYLARSNLVTMRGGIQVQYAPTARWAEPLDQGVSRAVAENLSRNSRIRAYGFSPGAPPTDHKYDVWIRLERFEGTDDGEVVLRGRWSVSSSDSSASVSSRTVDIRRNGWRPGDYPGLVRLLSEEISEMSHPIAQAIP